MKKISLGLIILTIILTFTSSAFASTPPLRREIRQAVKETVKEGRKEGLNPTEIEKDIKEVRMNLLNKVKNFMKKNLKFEARVRGKITVIGSNNFSLSGEDGVFQINITDKTKLFRKFGGKSFLSEYSVGDEVIVFGKFTDDTRLIIDAKVVKNNSIQKRWGAFFGKITVLNSDNFVIQTAERGVQTVYFGAAKFVNRNEVSISYNDVKIDDKVRVKGVWDKTLNKVSEVTQIKDFSFPPAIVK